VSQQFGSRPKFERRSDVSWVHETARRCPDQNFWRKIL